MFTLLPRRQAFAFLLATFALMLLPHSDSRADATGAALVAQAQELLDSYYGDQANLRLAATKLSAAMDAGRADANTYVQAARLTIMDGQLGGKRFKPDAPEGYHALLDAALALDPRNAKAHILKAEAHSIDKDYASEKASLDRAKALNTTDPWLSIGYARYYTALGDHTSAHYFYTVVEERGPGTTSSQRKAYVSAVTQLADYTPYATPEKLRSLAERARLHRHRADAWVLGTFAGKFAVAGLFDDGMAYATEAMRTMDHGYARFMLATSLYGKAAQLVSAGRQAEADPLIRQAERLGFQRAMLMEQMEGSSEPVQKMLPIFSKIIR